jgi:NADPH2:quinone reductase
MADRSIRAMRAAILRAYGAVPELGELGEPAAAERTEVLEVLAAGLNPVDVRIASGTFPNERHEPPYVAGKEGVGRRADGSLVYFDVSVEPYGAFAERTLIEAGSGYPVPDGLDPALAVCLGVAGLAAWLPLEWRGPLEPGQTVLILGASGVVGQIGVQAAKLLGAGRVVAAARSEEGLERARGLGADATVQLDPARRAQAPDLAAELREAAGGDGFDLVLDPLWGEPARAALAALKPFGRLVNMGQSADAKATLSSSAVRAKPVEIVGYTNYTAGDERKAAA